MLADQCDPVEIALARVRATHPLQYRGGARLQGQVDVLAQRGQLGVRPDHVLAHVLGMRTRVADPPDPLNGVDHRQQLREGHALGGRQVAAVGVDVLAEQGHLSNPIGGEAPHLLDQLARRPARLATARRGDDAVRADRVAADADLHPSLELPRALAGQAAREALELEVPLGGE